MYMTFKHPEDGVEQCGATGELKRGYFNHKKILRFPRLYGSREFESVKSNALMI